MFFYAALPPAPRTLRGLLFSFMAERSDGCGIMRASEAKESMMSALSRHPVAEVEQRLQALRRSGWTVTLSRNGTYYQIICKAGTMKTRITARAGRGLKGMTAREQLGLFLIRHNMKHPRE